jgi:diguanylate cyclase (GGDEF)-like protein/PAS domain S-box-containing protein
MSFSHSAAAPANAQSLLGLLMRIGDAAAAFTFAHAAQHAVREICEYSGWPAGHVHIVDRSAEPEKLVSAGDWYFMRPCARLGVREGLAGLILERAAPLYTKLKAGAWFGFPVLFENRLEAVIEFCTDSSVEIDAGLMQSAKSIGVLLACALQRERLGFLNLVVQKAHDAVIVYTVDRAQSFPLTIAYVNAELERQSGYEAAELVGNPRHLLQGPHITEESVRDTIERLLTGETIQRDVLKYRKDGSTFWVEVTMRPLLDTRGEVEYIVTVQRDITERKRTELELQLLSTALECANDMIAMMQLRIYDRWKFSYVNDAFVSATGFSREEIIGRDSRMLEGPETDVEQLRFLRRETLAGHSSHRQIAFYRKDGEKFWADVKARPIVDASGIATHAVILYRDVTDERERAELLSYEAAHDSLTGLYNRRYFMRELETAFREGHGGHSHAVLFMDLDRFKVVNDLHGHAAGDRVLSAVSERLHTAMREGDVVARVGGDEFAVLLHDCTPDAAIVVAEHLLKIVQSFALEFEDQTMHIGVSIGIADVKPGQTVPADAMHRADQACYAAKHSGGNRAVVA